MLLLQVDRLILLWGFKVKPSFKGEGVVEILPCYYADATMTISHIFVLVYICLTA